MYYYVYDRQNKKIMFDNKHFFGLDDCINQLIEFFSLDHTQKELQIIRSELIKNKEYADLVIMQSLEVI